MGIGAFLLVFGVAGLTPAVAAAAAIGATVRHARRSRVARFAIAPGAALKPGYALLRGEVIDDEEEPGPAAIVNLPADLPISYSVRDEPRAEARPFTLRLASGALVRVAPEPGTWLLDTTYATAGVTADPRYVATLSAGDEVFVAGEVQREHDARGGGRGYRDIGQAWVVRAPARGELLFSSAEVIAKHAGRARFHGAWALGLMTAMALVHFFVFGAAYRRLAERGVEAMSVGGGDAAIAIVFVVMVAAYHVATLETAPWSERKAARPA